MKKYIVINMKKYIVTIIWKDCDENEFIIYQFRRYEL